MSWRNLKLFFYHFDAILGSSVKRTTALDFNMLNVPSVDLTELDFCFFEEEVWKVTRVLPPNKAPGPDEFAGMFSQSTWPIIKNDIMQDFHALWQLDFRSFYLVNRAYMILLKKKPDADQVQDFCPIILIHSLSKLISKTFLLCLSSYISSLVMPNQSAFIKGRTLHDNFRIVQLSAKLLHAHLLPSVLLRVDIAKVFDTVSWPFLCDFLQIWAFAVLDQLIVHPLLDDKYKNLAQWVVGWWHMPCPRSTPG
jgi:hypothetical protein